MPGKKKGKAKSSQATKAQTVSTRPQIDDKQQGPKSGPSQQGPSNQHHLQETQPKEHQLLAVLVDNENPLLRDLNRVIEGPVQKAPEEESDIQQIVVKCRQKLMFEFERTLRCSITQELYTDPVVVAGDGNAYDRYGIDKWLKAKNSSPLQRNLVDPPENLAIDDQLTRALVNIAHANTHDENPGVPTLINKNNKFHDQLEDYSRVIKAVEEKIYTIGQHVEYLREKSGILQHIPDMLHQGPVISVILEFTGVRATSLFPSRVALLFPAIDNTFGKFAEGFLSVKAAKQPIIEQSKAEYDATEKVIAFPNRLLKSPAGKLLGNQSVISLINGETYATREEESTSDKKMDEKNNPDFLKKLVNNMSEKTLRPHNLAIKLVAEFKQLQKDTVVKPKKDYKHGVPQAPTKDSLVTAWGLFKKAVKSFTDELDRTSEIKKPVEKAQQNDQQTPAKASDPKDDNNEESYPKAPGGPSMNPKPALDQKASPALAANPEQKKSAKKKKKKKHPAAAGDPVSPKISESKDSLFSVKEILIKAVNPDKEVGELYLNLEIVKGFLNSDKDVLPFDVNDNNPRYQRCIYFTKKIIQMILEEYKLKKLVYVFAHFHKKYPDMYFVHDSHEFVIMDDFTEHLFCTTIKELDEAFKSKKPFKHFTVEEFSNFYNLFKTNYNLEKVSGGILSLKSGALCFINNLCLFDKNKLPIKIINYPYKQSIASAHIPKRSNT